MPPIPVTMIKHSDFVSRLLIDHALPQALVKPIASYTAFGVAPEGAATQQWLPVEHMSQGPMTTDASYSTKVELNGKVAGLTIKRSGSGFKFGAGSEKEMKGVHPLLLQVAKLALDLSTQDFIFYDGLRTLKEQVALKAKGMTKTLQSKHLPQSDGLGHAMDLVPYIGGGPKWDWEGCYRVAMAVDEAATKLNCAHQIRWGGAWDRTLADFGGNEDAYSAQVQEYQKRHEGKDFIDGPHYELVL